ncbi:hypothetical protein D554_3317 [Bordetella holmesii 30539]|nr:hypothetical protein D560_3419 [Bordetella holmesii ATCC 51541]AIT28032.1 hypothetical protein D558_3392 [Bordetella holmesii 44057]AMD47859.1 hypothetical protein F783_002640 [Bordetella holmesii F627]EWM40807.1 hypothetical protein D555_3452 [Bordetella holmesii 35009]EWM43666.1 hypothetical protein D556_3385 [Bordetella holmesii 41130]EXF88040.1 hypothetical protein D554_3317 [Bordetella holmesii 30539]EXX94040.1 hypothetical protein D559_1449 [Bordetella holmesii 1058]KAK78370.1 hypot
MYPHLCHTPLKPAPQDPGPEPGDIPVDPDSDQPELDRPFAA